MYHTDGSKIKTFTNYKFNKKTFDTKKNNQSQNENLNTFNKGLSHKRNNSIRNQFESQIILN